MDSKKVFVLKDYEGLGTHFYVELFLREKNIDEGKVSKRLKKEIEEFDDKYSRFKNDSLLNSLNKNRSIVFDYDLAKMIELANFANIKTDGVFDIFIKEKLEEKGYGKTEESNKKTFLENSTVEVKEEYIFIKGERSIDLGGVGKGYLIDKLAKILLEEFNIRYFLVNGGGDILVTSDYENDIELFLEHPTNKDEYIYKIKIKNKSFCSSSSFKRMWQKGTRNVNHFVNKENKEIWVSSYVVSKDASTADMFATVACLLSDNEEEIKRTAKDFSADYLIINEKGEFYKSDNFPNLIN